MEAPKGSDDPLICRRNKILHCAYNDNLLTAAE